MEWGGPDAKDLLADKGYDANSIRDDMEKRGGFAMIPMRKNRKEITPTDDFVYGFRNQVERCYSRMLDGFLRDMTRPCSVSLASLRSPQFGFG